MRFSWGPEAGGDYIEGRHIFAVSIILFYLTGLVLLAAEVWERIGAGVLFVLRLP